MVCESGQIRKEHTHHPFFAAQLEHLRAAEQGIDHFFRYIPGKGTLDEGPLPSCRRLQGGDQDKEDDQYASADRDNREEAENGRTSIHVKPGRPVTRRPPAR